MTSQSWTHRIGAFALLCLPLGLGTGCDSDSEGDDHGDDKCEEGHDHEHGEEEEDHGHSHGECGEETEVITTVTLTFTPASGGSAVTAVFDDPDGNGIMAPVVDDIALTSGETYTLGIELSNALEEPAEDVTAEIEEESEEHQFFIYGSAVNGPASTGGAALVDHAYADVESDYGPNAGEDLPVGLTNTITANAAGTGDFSVMLRHLPELNGEAQKVAGLAEDFAAGEALPGDPDVDITFSLTVQ